MFPDRPVTYVPGLYPAARWITRGIIGRSRSVAAILLRIAGNCPPA